MDGPTALATMGKIEEVMKAAPAEVKESPLYTMFDNLLTYARALLTRNMRLEGDIETLSELLQHIIVQHGGEVRITRQAVVETDAGLWSEPTHSVDDSTGDFVLTMRRRESAAAVH